MDPVTLLRVAFLLSYLSLGIFVPFLSLYLTRRGLGPEQVPVVMAVVPLVRVVAPPIWGWIADQAGSRTLVLKVLAAISLGASLLIPWADGLVVHVGVFALLSATQGPIFPLLDAIALATTARLGVQYGTVRNLGSLGFLLGVMLGGPLWEGDGILLAHRGLSGAMVLVVLAALMVPDAEPTPAPPGGAAPGAGLLAALSQPALLALFAVVFLHTTAHTGYDMYFALHCEKIGLSTQVTALAWSCGVLAEVLVLGASGALLTRVGPVRLIWLGVAVAAARWLLIAGLSSPWLLVPLQALHAITFGCWFLGSITLVDRLSPPGLRASSQGAFCAIIGLANATGSLVWGPLGARYGTRSAFSGMALGELVVLGLAVWLLRSLRAREAATAPDPGTRPAEP